MAVSGESPADWTPIFVRIAGKAFLEGARINGQHAIALGAPTTRPNGALVDEAFKLAFLRWLFGSGWKTGGVPRDVLAPRLEALVFAAAIDWSLTIRKRIGDPEEWRALMKRFYREANDPRLARAGATWEEVLGLDEQD